MISSPNDNVRSGARPSPELDANCPSRDDAVVACNLAKQYRLQDGVRGLDLTVPRGAKFGILGPNGAGKSTTLSMIMGMIKPDAGTLNVLGQGSPHEVPLIRARIGYVPERHCMYPWMTVAEITRFTREFYPTWDNGHCAALIQQFALPLDKRVGQLSHGMQTKLSLVLALSHYPELLILDEPTTGLDPMIREEFLHGIREMCAVRPECTLLVSSHIMIDIETVTDTVAIMNEGRLILCAPRRELLARTRRVEIHMCNTVDDLPHPPGCLHTYRSGDVIRMTIHDFSEPWVSELRGDPRVRTVQVHDVSLDDLFKATILGARAACGSR